VGPSKAGTMSRSASASAGGVGASWILGTTGV
jgi:hypothetical protein